MLPRGNTQIAVLKIIVRALDTSLVTFWTGTGLLLVLGSHGMIMFTESVVAAANEPTKRKVRDYCAFVVDTPRMEMRGF